MSWQNDLAHAYKLTPRQVTALESLVHHLELHADRGLTAVTERDNIIDIHLRDSLSLLALPETGPVMSVIDVGSGGGFPGLPLAIARPSVSFSLLESNSRKCIFIESCIDLLGLRNARVINSRAETAGHAETRESFDLALARALGPLPVVLELALPLVRPGGFLLMQRGGRRSGDEAVALEVAPMLGGSLRRVVPVKPYPQARRLHVWVFEKQNTTPDCYPRRPGIPRKRPLGD